MYMYITNAVCRVPFVVCRWDTCAAEAVLKAFGGNYGKLSLFATAEGTQGITQGYTYLKSECNLDPNGLASMTKYNSKVIFRLFA